MPFFFDLSSLIPQVERNPFAPVQVDDEPQTEEDAPAIQAEPIIDTGLPIPAHYDVDLMRALVQDPFHLFVHWQLKSDPFDRLRNIFPAEDVASFRTVLKLVDETNQISVFADAAFTREYWLSVFPNRRYRVELGVRSSKFGFIKLLSSQSVLIPRAAPSDLSADEGEYEVSADDYLRVLRDSHLISARTFDPLQWWPLETSESNPPGDPLPAAFRRILKVISDIQSGRDYDRLWVRLEQEELTGMVREFLFTMSRVGDGELGYFLLLQYLPELFRRAVAAEGEIQIDEPVSLYLARHLGAPQSETPQREGSVPVVRTTGSSEMHPWFPSATL